MGINQGWFDANVKMTLRGLGKRLRPGENLLWKIIKVKVRGVEKEKGGKDLQVK